MYHDSKSSKLKKIAFEQIKDQRTNHFQLNIRRLKLLKTKIKSKLVKKFNHARNVEERSVVIKFKIP